MKHLMLVVALWSALGLACGNQAEPSNCGDEVVEVSSRTEDITREFEASVRAGQLRERTNIALNAMVRFAIFKLRLKGHKVQAAKLQSEWENTWQNDLMRRDLGDHRPLSQWLAQKYDMLEFLLGATFMELTRLVDIKVINFSIPVVFSCIDNVDEVEFGKHFVPLAKVAVYWGSFFACVGATWGSGFLFCSPISMGCEYVTGKWIAPRLNPSVWEWSCH